MGDISFRAVEVLRSVSGILAEDTRHSRRLLDHYGIPTSLTSYHEHNEARETPRLVERLKDGSSFALISDAGTPLLSDPGSRLVAAAALAGIPVVSVPGASALLAALVVSGLAAEPFTFFGFLPRKSGDRAAAVAAVVQSAATSVIYEAPGRVARTLADLVDAGAGDRAASLSREMTKKFEETVRGTVAGLARTIADTEPRGEFVIVVSGKTDAPLTEDAMSELAGEYARQGLSSRDITERLISQHGAARNSAYRIAHSSTQEQGT